MQAALRHFREVLQCADESFDACLLLGKISYRQEDYAKAAAFFERAAKTDPARYALEGLPVRFLDSLRTQKRTNGQPAYRIVIHMGQEEEQAVRPVVRATTYGDFQSREEWLEHADQPPFEPGAGADIDWDEEARKIFGD